MGKRHAVQVLREAGLTQREIQESQGVSARTVRRIEHEAQVTEFDDAAERERRRIGRPSKVEACRAVSRSERWSSRPTSPSRTGAKSCTTKTSVTPSSTALERGRVVKLDGPSIRTQHVDPADLDGGDQSA